jgi:hypothetical protein
MAAKKYPTLGADEALQKLTEKICSKGAPVNSAAGLAEGGPDWVKKQTDTSQYTGSHALRFDESGKGRGLAGRDSVAKGGINPGDLGHLLDRSDADVRGVKK